MLLRMSCQPVQGAHRAQHTLAVKTRGPISSVWLIDLNHVLEARCGDTEGPDNSHWKELSLVEIPTLVAWPLHQTLGTKTRDFKHISVCLDLQQTSSYSFVLH